MGRFDLREALAKNYHAAAESLFVYCREAHTKPFGTLGDRLGPPRPQTHSWEERAERARSFRQQYKVGRHVLVDEDGEGSVQQLYGGKDNQLVVIGPDGCIALKLDHADTQALKEFLEEHLGAGPMADRQPFPLRPNRSLPLSQRGAPARA